MSIKLSIEHFHKFTNLLKKNSNIDVKRFEKDCINKIIKVKKRDDKYSIIIVNITMSDLILELFSEPETKRSSSNWH